MPRRRTRSSPSAIRTSTVSPSTTLTTTPSPGPRRGTEDRWRTAKATTTAATMALTEAAMAMAQRVDGRGTAGTRLTSDCSDWGQQATAKIGAGEGPAEGRMASGGDSREARPETARVVAHDPTQPV